MKRRRIMILLATCLLFVIAFVGSIMWNLSGPVWCLSARNSADGIMVQVYKGEQATPTYTTLLKGHTIPRDIGRLTCRQVPADVGSTTFVDETVRPGRWTLILGGIKLDIMERAMVLADGTEVPPSD